MGTSIVVAVFTGLMGIGGLMSGNWGVWLLPVCGVSIVTAVISGKEYGRQSAALREDGVERDGLYLTPEGLVVRSHGRYQVVPLENIRAFDIVQSIDTGSYSVRLLHVSDGVDLALRLGGTHELEDLLNAWLTSARGT